MSGCVGVIANDSARFTMFSACLTQLHSPVNTTIEWGVGSDRSVGRNNVVRAALERGAEWVFFVDDDMVFGPDILMQLLDRNVDIVGGLYVQRGAPFYPIAYDQLDVIDGVEHYRPVDLRDHHLDGGLISVVGAGTGGMLIRSEVFHALSRDFEGRHEWFTHTTAKSEDLMFCDAAIDAGFEVWVDPRSRLGHMAPAAVWPVWNKEADEWEIGWVFSESARMSQSIGTVGLPERET